MHHNNQPVTSDNQLQDSHSDVVMTDIQNTVDGEDSEAGDVTLLHFCDEDVEFVMFLSRNFDFGQHPIADMSESALLELKEKYDCYAASVDHLPHEVSSGAEETPEPCRPPDDPAESGVPKDVPCLWVNKKTNQTCCKLVPAGRESMLLHLNTVHSVRGPEKLEIECRWAACGAKFQRRNIPRHIAKHLGFRSSCKLCSKDFARQDLLKDHIDKDHSAQETNRC
ncbi:uncharacterized protein EDB91DRAFT_1248222 [Suillus paluster]|uniref:uncharacterized protein n=1 Tax=Suillus paluster TaxID=48578 RepID=UPI001B86D3C2|nr:uncharacterized protein EDB91DRAFT_1248222 [Suillus paluster]KAG1740834.1 hypothetical protein EDB91DRAFT_1248222 [Suillus paluster]